MHGTHGAEPQLIPERPGFVAPEKTLKRPSNIYVDFIEAIKEGRKAANDFEVSAKSPRNGWILRWNMTQKI